MLKNVLLSLAALLCGALIAFYGVFLSVFADGNLTERLILITVVLFILFILSAFFAYIEPRKALLNGSFLGGGGVIVLLLVRENIYYLLYGILIILLCLTGVYVGKRLNIRHKSKNKSIKN